MEFCQKFTEGERVAGHLLPGMEYRLPTEAQWEYACRAGTTGDYAGPLDSMAWYRANSGEIAHPVKMKRPNPWGLYDMHGNVLEWCSDWYASYSPESQVNPAGPVDGAFRVARGGSWLFTGAYCRSAARYKNSPGTPLSYLGLRLALVLIYAPASAPIPPPPPKIDFLAAPALGKSYHTSAGTNMVWIAPGSFQMGDSTGHGDSDEKPVHEVRLTTGYWLGESDVTQDEWQAVIGYNPSHTTGGNLPVESVSWSDAAEYCQKLTQRERDAGHLLPGMHYDLPTEAQWEYACRAGTTGDYAGDLEAMTWYHANSRDQTHDVKTKRPNAWGLYDMHGNVWEWCSDWYGSYSAGTQVDPTGPANGAFRVRRGGAASLFSPSCRSAYRNRLTPDIHDHEQGFRLAAVPSNE
jgi:formylglycine-generating enzyme required for sulfatase activity